jgi:phosphoenolpyruvate carboxykinase (ATP)
MSLPHTRAMVRAALSGSLADVATRREPVFNLEVPVDIDGVPSELLDPRSTWSDPAEYDAQAARLAGLFHKNFEQFAGRVPGAVREAGPPPPAGVGVS